MTYSGSETRPTLGAVGAAVAGLVAGWVGAGSVGLLGHAFRRGLLWALLGVVAVAAWPQPRRTRLFLLAMLLACAAAVPMIASEIRAINVLAVVLFVVAAAQGQTGPSQTLLRWSAEGVALLAIFRVAATCIPIVWLVADAVGTALGKVAGFLTGHGLWVGSTFGGVDYLVVMLYLAVRATRGTVRAAPPCRTRWQRSGLAVAMVLLGHLIYLNLLSYAPAVRERLPEPSPAGTYWVPHPDPPGLDAAVHRLLYGDSDYQGEPSVWEPAVRRVVGFGFRLGQWLREAIPWNIPVLAACIHALLAWWILRRLWVFSAEPSGPAGSVARWMPSGLAVGTAALLALLLAAAGTLSLHRPTLQGKKIVFYKEGYLNWLKPKHGRSDFDYGQYAIGMYGMMPIYLRSYGAEAVISPDLSEADLAGAQVLVLIFPNKPWKPAENGHPGQLERIERFVRAGGTLLVLGEHTILDLDLLRVQDPELADQLAGLYKKCEALEHAKGEQRYSSRQYQSALQAGRSNEELQQLAQRLEQVNQNAAELARQVDQLRAQLDPGEVMRRHRAAEKSGPLNRFNEVLGMTDLRVAFDSATFAIGGWLQSYEALAHPSTAGLSDAQNAFGSVIGASVEVHWPRGFYWPARPLLIGRWGWNDPGNVLHYPSFMANEPGQEARYDPGERLGDIVLAAEQPVGRGRVVLFGDTSGFGNGILINSHIFLSRLFAYLAEPAGSPQEPARQLAALVLAALLATLLVVRPSHVRLVAASLALAGGLAVCTAATHRAWELLPDGRGFPGAPNHLAYLDAAHLGHYSPEGWRDDGLMGLCMNLMRNDYLVLMLHELKREALLAPGVDLGMTVRPLQPAEAKQFGIDPPQGVVVREIEPHKAADRLGLKPGNIILAVQGRPVRRAEDFQAAMEAIPPGEQIVFRIHGREAFPLAFPNATPKARLFISVAPGRPFSPAERELIRDFVRSGGVFICTVGYEESGPSRQLLEELGFYVGGRRWQWLDNPSRGKAGWHYQAGSGWADWHDTSGEPRPLGYFKRPYFNGGDYLAFVRFWSAWPVECLDRGALVIADYQSDLSVFPLIVLRRFGQGLVLVVGDTAFAHNKNLENRDGSTFDGMRENAVFWRWLVALLRDGMGEGERWYPQKIDTVPEGQHAAVPSAAPAAPAQSAKPAKPAKPVKPAEQAEPAKPGKPVKPLQPVTGTTPAAKLGGDRPTAPGSPGAGGLAPRPMGTPPINPSPKLP